VQRGVVSRCGAKGSDATGTDLLHDSRFALREGDMSARLILDELDLDLASFTTRLVVVVVVVVDRAGSLALGAAVLSLDAIAITNGVVVARRRISVVFGDFAGHVAL
jgi:hypothetical protein